MVHSELQQRSLKRTQILLTKPHSSFCVLLLFFNDVKQHTLRFYVYSLCSRDKYSCFNRSRTIGFYLGYFTEYSFILNYNSYKVRLVFITTFVQKLFKKATYSLKATLVKMLTTRKQHGVIISLHTLASSLALTVRMRSLVNSGGHATPAASPVGIKQPTTDQISASSAHISTFPAVLHKLPRDRGDFPPHL